MGRVLTMFLYPLGEEGGFRVEGPERIVWIEHDEDETDDHGDEGIFFGGAAPLWTFFPVKVCKELGPYISVSRPFDGERGENVWEKGRDDDGTHDGELVERAGSEEVVFYLAIGVDEGPWELMIGEVTELPLDGEGGFVNY